MKNPMVKHGMYYGLAAQKAAAAPAAAAAETQAAAASSMQGEGGWYAQQLGSPQRIHHRPTAEDVDALLAMPAGATPAQLSATAFARGLHMPPAAAEKFVDAVAIDEASRRALEERLRELQSPSGAATPATPEVSPDFIRSAR